MKTLIFTRIFCIKRSSRGLKPRKSKDISATIDKAMFLMGHNEYDSSLTKPGFALLAL